MDVGEGSPPLVAPVPVVPTEATPRRPSRAGTGVAAAGLVLVAGAVLRFWCRSDLWLDEALTVNIARLPLSELPEALRHDGSPPLFYLLLHGWTGLFGSGDVAVRSLSGVIGLASLPLAWLAGLRLGGRRVAAASVLLLASSPFAVRYSTEARMYGLVVLLTLVGYLALSASLERPSLLRLAAVGLTTALLLLSHYWSLYLVAVVGGWLALRARNPGASAARRCLAAMGAGGLLFLLWAPVFVHHLLHTGTPWARPPSLAAVLVPFDEFGGSGWAGAWLGMAFVLLFALGVLGRPLDRRRIELDLSAAGPARPLAAAAAATVVLGVVAGILAGSGFVGRYAAVVLVPFLLVVAVGTTAFADDRLRRGVLGALVVLGLVSSAGNVSFERTQAGEVAAAIERLATPGDLVAYCPDQLGPSVSRVLDADGLQQVTFPDLAGPERVDWVDYLDRARARDPSAFAAELLARAGPGGDVFVVGSSAYRVVGRRCQRVVSALEESRPGVVRVRRDADAFESMTLSQFPPRR